MPEAESNADRARARAEMLYCERILAKSSDTLLSATLPDLGAVTAWRHYPEPDVFDPDSGAQWYYHCHLPGFDAVEHGHFHCFLRPDGAAGPVHHLIAIGVDGFGRLHRLFTVNRWVVGDTWLDAEATIALLPRFDVELARPSYLVNRWLTAVLTLHEADIAQLLRERDAVLAAHKPPEGVDARDDRALEATSWCLVDAGAPAASP